MLVALLGQVCPGMEARLSLIGPGTLDRVCYLFKIPLSLWECGYDDSFRTGVRSPKRRVPYDVSPSVQPLSLPGTPVTVS